MIPVDECSGGLAGLGVTLTLTVDSCADFDMYVYDDSCTGSLLTSCTGGAGVWERKCLSWTDVPLVDNSRDLYVKIIAYPQTFPSCCGYWELEVRGNICWCAEGGCPADC